MLSAIGETLEPASGGEELITGVIMSARPNLYRISIWTSKAEDPEETAVAGSIGNRLLEIGKHFKTQILGYDINQKIGGNLSSDVEFQSHKESEKKKGKKFVVVSCSWMKGSSADDGSGQLLTSRFSFP